MSEEKNPFEGNYMENYEKEMYEVRDIIEKVLDTMNLQDLRSVQDAIAELGFDMSANKDKEREDIGVFKDMSGLLNNFFKSLEDGSKLPN